MSFFSTSNYYGAVNPATATPAQHLAAIRGACAALQTAGGGTLLYDAGPLDIEIWPDATDVAEIYSFSNLPFVRQIMNGRRLVVNRSWASGQALSAFIYTNCAMILARDFRAKSTNEYFGAEAHLHGVRWHQIAENCRYSDFCIEIEGGLYGVHYERGVGTTEADMAYGNHHVRGWTKLVAYPCSTQLSCIHLDVDLYCDKSVRSFIGYSDQNLKLKIVSIDPYTVDVLLSTTGTATFTGGETIGKWDVDYHRLPNSGAVTAGPSCVVFRFAGETDAQVMNQARLKLLNEAADVYEVFGFYARGDNELEMTSGIPAHSIGILDLNVHTKYAPPPAYGQGCVRLMNDAKWANVTVEQVRLNILVEGAVDARADIGTYAFRNVLEDNVQAPIVNYMGTRAYSHDGPESSAEFDCTFTSGTGATIGNGILKARLIRLTPKRNNVAQYAIHFRFEHGSTTNLGTGSAFMGELPVPFDTLKPLEGYSLRALAYFHMAGGGGNVTGMVTMSRSAPGKFDLQWQNYGQVWRINNSTPSPWAAGDKIEFDVLSGELEG